MFPKVLLNSLLLAPFLAVNPAFAVVTIRLTRHLNTANALNILKFDQARATFLATGVSNWDEPELLVVNQAQYYSANVGIGVPPTYCTFWKSNYFSCFNGSPDSLLVDTGR